MFPEILGHELKDALGSTRRGVITIPITILKQPADIGLTQLYTQWRKIEGITGLGLISDTANANTYDAYGAFLAGTPTESVDFQGILVFGEEDQVKELMPRESFELL